MSKTLFCFFDTNFISKIERSIEIDFLNKHVLETTAHPIISSASVHVVLNPINLLEYSGQKLIGLSNIPRRLRKPGKTPYLDWITKLFSWLQDSAEEQSAIVAPKIKGEISKKKNESTPDSFKYKFFAAAENMLTLNSVETFSYDLALLGIGSIIGGLDLHNENERRTYHKLALQFLFGRIAEGHLSTIGKISAKILIELHNSGKASTVGLPPQELLERWGWESDLSDDMLITLSLFGTPSEDGSNVPVNSFTCDSQDEVIARLRSAIFTTYFIDSLEKDRINAGKEEQFKIPKLCPGNVHFYSVENSLFHMVQVETLIKEHFPEYAS